MFLGLKIVTIHCYIAKHTDMTFVQQFLITTAALVISELFVHQASGLAGKGDGPTDKDRL